MDNKIKGITILLVVAMVAVVAVVVIAGGHGNGNNTDQTVEFTFDPITGWEKTYDITPASYSSSWKYDLPENEYLGGYRCSVPVEYTPESTLPGNLKIYVQHDITQNGYQWAFSGTSSEHGTWSGIASFTLNDDSGYNGTTHILRYTVSW